jgi:hypothetical protein
MIASKKHCSYAEDEPYGEVNNYNRAANLCNAYLDVSTL